MNCPWRSKSRLERRLMLSLIFGMICLVAGPAPSAEPEHKYDGVYTGKRSSTKGTQKLVELLLGKVDIDADIYKNT